MGGRSGGGGGEERGDNSCVHWCVERSEPAGLTLARPQILIACHKRCDET